MAYLICKVVAFDKVNEKIEIEPISGDEVAIKSFIQNGGSIKSTFIESSNIKIDFDPQEGKEEDISAEIKFNYRKSY